jgi:hypothetical protein
MTLSHTPTEADLIDLIDCQVSEDKAIDYKLQLSVNNDEEKKEFLADVVSFANTVGGFLIIGMKEEKGIAIALPGVQIDDPDQTKLRLEEIIRDGITPRIAGISIQLLQLNNGDWAISIYIPKSLSAPHMVAYKKSSRFYARHSAGKYQLDVQGIREAFLLSESTAEKIRDFRLDRVAKVNASDTSVTMIENPKIILHSIPLSAFQTSQGFEMSNIHFKFFSHSNEYDSHRFNLDGVLFYKHRRENIAHEYLQMFRNGHFEYVNADIISPWIQDKT